MRPRRSSLAARASWAAFVSAGLATVIAVIASSVFAEALIIRANDQRLDAAASELAHELATRSDASFAAIVQEEQAEVAATGVRLVVHAKNGELVAGDGAIPRGEGCRSERALRVCTLLMPNGNQISAGLVPESHRGLLFLAALGASALTACVAWALARLLGRRAVGPLLRLQARLAGLPLGEAARGKPAPTDLGADEGVSEVDDLRTALGALLARMQQTIDRTSRFAANAAHELRTPLTTLRGELELLAERPGSGDAPELETALRKVDQLQTLTERLLVLATPEENMESFELVSLRDVIDDVVGDLTELERMRVTMLDDADVFVRGDAAALRIVVSNGVSNALKFAEHVEIELQTEDTAAIIAIDDDGPGVSEDARESVFEPFVRGAHGTRAPGHGLGLALVAHVARWHSGDARLLPSRRRRHGARLEVRIPRAESQ